MNTNDHCGKQSRRWYITLFGRRFGLEHSTVHFVNGPRRGARYLERIILYFGLGTLRLQRFWEGDDIRAPHDHPWSFITFPLTGYYETVYEQRSDIHNEELHWVSYVRFVRPFRFHYRHAMFRHIVHMKNPETSHAQRENPFWTFVITGEPVRHGRPDTWGFYPEPDQFVSYRDWEDYCMQHNL